MKTIIGIERGGGKGVDKKLFGKSSKLKFGKSLNWRKIVDNWKKKETQNYNHWPCSIKYLSEIKVPVHLLKLRNEFLQWFSLVTSIQRCQSDYNFNNNKTNWKNKSLTLISNICLEVCKR